MAFRRSSRFSRRPRRRRAVRRTTRTRRSTRFGRSRISRRVMSRRHILNISSRKKQDTMLSTDPVGIPGGYSGGSATFLFCPSFRERAEDVTGETEDANGARTAESTYVRGIKEKIFVTINGGSPLRWRRIIYSTKDRASGVTSGSYQAQIAGGIRVRPMQVQNPASVTALGLQIMTGNQGQDYLTLLSGKTDPHKVLVHHDSTRILNPENATGYAREHDFWTPINKTLIYDDNEFGEDETSSPWSTLGRLGLGNIFILDIFDIALTTTPATTFQFIPATTYYWHEK